MMFDIEALKAMTGENGLGALFMALLYSVLAYFTMGGSVTALVIAMVVYAADWLAGFAFSTAEGAKPNIGGIIVRILFLALMYRGLKGGLELRKQRKAAATTR